MIEESYISFDTAKLLKEAGFDLSFRGVYVTDRTGYYEFREYDNKQTTDDLCWNTEDGFQYEYLAPTQALATRWLREVHKIHVYAIQTNLPYTEPQTTKWEWGYIIDMVDDPNSNVETCEMYFASYEAALEAGIAKCLELIKK